MNRAILAGAIFIWGTSVLAHSPLERTVPAHEALLAQAPANVALDFKGNIRLTQVTLKHSDQNEADLDLDGFNGFISDYTIPVPSMGPGTYVIEWRGLSDDGHPMNGTFSFTVAE